MRHLIINDSNFYYYDSAKFKEYKIYDKLTVEKFNYEQNEIYKKILLLIFDNQITDEKKNGQIYKVNQAFSM